jgi:hypothetical protein
MSDQATVATAAHQHHEAPGALEAAAQSRWLSRILPLIVFLIVVVAAALRYHAFLLGEGNEGNSYIPFGFGIILAIVLSLLPAMICVVQNTTRRRQMSRLANLKHFPVGRTAYFNAAQTAVDTLRTGAVDADFQAPLFVYFFIIFLCFVAFLIGYDFQTFFSIPNIILGGLRPTNDPDLVAYQAGTYCVLAIAFVASYIYSLGRLLDRVNNNDLYPLSLYIYSVHVVIACVVAAVLRHTASVFGLDSTAILLLIAFGVGFAPDLFLIAILRRAFQVMKVWGNRGDPTATQPTTLPLLMIDDLSRDKVDRLGELGIDSAQVLARQNPFLLLPRLPFDLVLIVDWIAQAQLYALVKDVKLEALRNTYIRDVFDLHLRLANEAARPAVCTTLGITDGEACALRQQLDEDPSFTRLQEVRAALIPH